MLPPISTESVSAGGLYWTFTVPIDYPFFRGHFPGHPILPGVVALSWLLAGAARYLGRPVGAAELANVKFQVVILPGAEIELSITPKGGGRLHGVVSSRQGVHASALIPAQEA